MTSKRKKVVEGKFVSDADSKFNIVLRSKVKEEKLKTDSNDVSLTPSRKRSYKKPPSEQSVTESDDESGTYVKTPKKNRHKENLAALRSNRKSQRLNVEDSSQVTPTSLKKAKKNSIVENTAQNEKTDISLLNTPTSNRKKTPKLIKESTRTPNYPKTPTSSKRSCGNPRKIPRKLSLSEDPTKSPPATCTPTSCLGTSKCEQTPSVVRKKLSFELQDREELSDYSDSSDDYIPSSEEDESEQVESEDEAADTETSTFYDTPRRKKLSPISEKTAKTRFSKYLEDDTEYIINADDYFVSKSSKGPTSNNKLSTIDVPRLKEDDLKNVLLKNYIKHPLEANALLRHHETLFHLWLFYLKEGFNLLMYGLGSKIEVLNHFQNIMLSEHFVCTLHGYFPGLTIKDILNSLVIDILKEKKCPTNIEEALSLIESTLKQGKNPIFLIIHNIDGVVFRRNKCQCILSKLASFKNLHVIATMDHINGPLMWGASILNRFKFLYLNVTTYKPHLNETSFENSLHLAQTDSDMVSLSSLKEIFKPLPNKTKKIFQIIAKDHLENRRSKQYKGFSYDDWYTRSKRSFSTNGKNAFRVQITEFIDHNIIKINADGVRLNIDPDILSTFYTQQFPDE